MNNEGFLEELKKIAEASKTKGTQLDATLTALQARTLDLEQRILVKGVGDNTYDPNGAAGNLGMLVASDAKIATLKSGDAQKVQIHLARSIKAIAKSVIGNEGAGATTGYPTTPMTIPGGPRFTGRRLSVLAALPYISVTDTASVNVPQLISNTDAAAPQSAEGALKAETALDFQNVTLTIPTIAHFLNASKQVLSDNSVLADFISRVLIAGALRKFESLIVSGDGGAVDKIKGLIPSATSYAPTATAPVDALGEALSAMDSNGYSPSIVVLNNFDLFGMLSERTATGYVGAGWSAGLGGKLWGCTITTSSALPAGTALIIDESCVAVIDRQQATVAISTVDKQFVQNEVTILAELRGTLAVLDKGGIYVVALPGGA